MTESMIPVEEMTTEFTKAETLQYPEFGKMYDVVEINKDGMSLLGSSQFCSRYWNGNLAFFASPNHIGSLANCHSCINLDGGLPCAKFISETKVVVGLDTGVVSVVDVPAMTSPATSGPMVSASVLAHDDSVATLAVTRDGAKFVSGSHDRSIKVWNAENLSCTHTYRPAHVDMVLDVAIHPENDNVLVSCSEDGEFILWDTRLLKPAFGFGKPSASRATCLTFRRNGNLIIGTASGHILELDVATSGPKASTASTFPMLLELGAQERPVRKVVVSPDDDTLVASCADEGRVVVTAVDPAHPSILYTDHRHTDFVRGLSWLPAHLAEGSNRLYSCGWDRQVVVHDLSNLSRK